MKFDEQFFNKIWYSDNKIYQLLLPLSWIFCTIRLVRLKFYQWGFLASVKIKVPVIIVGNITVGGTGKTMLIIALAKFLKKSGFKPGIVSRGYHGQSPVWPLSVTKNSDPVLVGDEPVLLSYRTDCPVVVAPDRVEACETLLHRYDCDVILSDDGLQHYHLKRDLEIAVIDGERLMGNCHCLPAGPLREPKTRLQTVTKTVTKGIDSQLGERMDVISKNLYDISDPKKIKKIKEIGNKVRAVAGIGNPYGFYQELRDNGLEVIEHNFENHHSYSQSDFEFGDNIPMIVTEKDAVKIKRFRTKNIWVLPVEAKLSPIFYDDILKKLNSVK